MFRLIGTLVVLGLTFYVGYYVGQRSLSDVTKTLGGFSRELMDKTLGFERMLRLRQAALDAKGLVVQAKGDVIDRNYGSAAKALAEAGNALEKGLGIERTGETAAKLKALLSTVHTLQQELKAGNAVERGKLEAVEKRLDELLGS